MDAIKRMFKTISSLPNKKLKNHLFSFITAAKQALIPHKQKTESSLETNISSTEKTAGMCTPIQKQLSQDNQSRSDILPIINKITDLLINATPTNFPIIFYNAITIIAKAIDIDQVSIYKNHLSHNELHYNQIYNWPKINNSQQELNKSYNQTIPTWEVELSNNNCINSIVSKLSCKEQEQLITQSTTSLIAIPIFIKNRFWGFVSYNDFSKQRTFSKDEEETLRLISKLLVNSFLHNELDTLLREKNTNLKTELEKAKTANKAKSDFLATMSHEFRAPLHAIINYANFGNNTDNIERKNQALNKINQASSQLLHLVNENLEFAKIEANKLELVSKEFDIKNTIQNIVSIIEYQTNKKNQTLTINIDQNIPPLLIGDDYRLNQVITNLLNNAVKFTPEDGSIELTVKMISEENNTCQILFSITDSGIGISHEQQSRLFTPFEQAASETTHKYGGTGLGLAISKRIVELMDGKIWVESEEGKGSRFNFTIMVNKSPFVDNSLDTNTYNKDDNPDFTGYTILVAEDEEINREIIDITLENTHLQIVYAEDGKQALDAFILEPDKYDLIFMDIQMPHLNGYQATNFIRNFNHPTASNIPIIAMTGNAFPEDVERCKAIGMNEHIAKPFEPDIIKAVLKKYLKGKDIINIDSLRTKKLKNTKIS